RGVAVGLGPVAAEADPRQRPAEPRTVEREDVGAAVRVAAHQVVGRAREGEVGDVAPVLAERAAGARTVGVTADDGCGAGSVDLCARNHGARQGSGDRKCAGSDNAWTQLGGTPVFPVPTG